MPKWSEEGRRREQAAGGGGERRRRGSGGRFEAGSGLGVPARRGKSVWGLGAATGLPQAADGARHGPAMAAAMTLCLPAHTSRGAGAGRSAEQEGVAGWLTRVLGLLLAHTGAWFAMENRSQLLVCFWVKKQQREKEKRAGQHVETSGERWPREERGDDRWPW